MNKQLLVTLVLMSWLGWAFSQQKVSDGTGDGGALPNKDAILELESNNKGLLHTRVSLRRTTEAAPLSDHVAGIMVYNTATANDVVPGIYYNNGAKWVFAGGVTQGSTNISYNPETYEITYIDGAGNPQVLDLGEVVRSNETVTELAYDAATGTATYTNEAGAEQSIDLSAVVDSFETVTSVSLDSAAGTLTYTDEGGTETVLDLGEVVRSNETVTELVDNGDGTFTYTNEAGEPVTFDANTTTVTNNNNGTYTITKANGDVVMVDVVGDVVSNIQNEDDIYNEIINLIDSIAVTTAENGLTKDGHIIELGGELTKPTTITTSSTSTLAITGLEDGDVSDNIIIADANGVLKQIKAAMPKFFYMPSVVIPTHDVNANLLTGTQTIDLHARYAGQFGFTGGANQVRSNAGSDLPVLPANELDYFVTYFDDSVFTNVSVSVAGVLNYEVLSTAVITNETFMNIVFKVKD